MTAFASNLCIPYVIAGTSLAVSLFLLPKLFKKISPWAYAGVGAAMWYCMLLGGVNACVAGVAAALAVPVAQLAPADTKAPSRQPGQMPSLIDHLIHNLVPCTALLILPLFALANAAAPVRPREHRPALPRPAPPCCQSACDAARPAVPADCGAVGCRLSHRRVRAGEPGPNDAH